MSHRTHDLAHEFPEFKARIHDLKSTDNHFKRLAGEYEGVCEELHRAGEGAGVIDDERAEALKRKRLELKDRLFVILTDGGKKNAGSCCGSCH